MFRIIVIALIMLSSFGFFLLDSATGPKLQAAVNCPTSPSYTTFSGMGHNYLDKNKENKPRQNVKLC